MENSATQSATPPVPPAEELLKKIHELELAHAHLKQEMSKLITSSAAEIMAAGYRQKHRAQSVSPQRNRRWKTGGGDGSLMAAWKKGSASFRHSSPLLTKRGVVEGAVVVVVRRLLSSMSST